MFNLKYIESPRSDVSFNLALEEYLLYHFKAHSYLLLWVNDRSIVVGRNQNVFEEINVKTAEEAGIMIARRISGGGTVYHDKGNLNYTFITDYDPNQPVDYDRFIGPVVSALNSIGVRAEKRGSSDIVIGDMKISGNAQASKKGRVLHHGTLLFDADLSALGEYLKPPAADIVSKAVKSRRSSVTNISEYIEGLTMEDFRQALLKAFFPGGIQKVELSEEVYKAVEELVDTKFSTWDWNYGRSPKFSFEKKNVKLSVEKGIVASCTVYGIDLPIIGVRYSYKDIYTQLKTLNLEEIASSFF